VSEELSEVRYFPLAELLTIELEFATRASLERLKVWLTMNEADRQTRTTIPVMREKVWYEE
jgi:hypothetical protein